VLYIDLDDVKTINATLGQDAGDEPLCETAQRVRKTLRAADTPARLGGDEFAVMVVDREESAAGSGTCGPDALVRNTDVDMYVSKRGFSVYQREMEVAR
jgi:predicted signal transduction protein with EAL and GGDEF domain